jgi:hypothetical protein
VAAGPVRPAVARAAATLLHREGSGL